MNNDEILAKLTEIFREVFDDEELVITPDTVPDDVDGWDSVGNVYLLVEMEEEFGIKIDRNSITINNVKDLITLVNN